jgi:hypothetical protein
VSANAYSHWHRAASNPLPHPTPQPLPVLAATQILLINTRGLIHSCRSEGKLPHFLPRAKIVAAQISKTFLLFQHPILHLLSSNLF